MNSLCEKLRKSPTLARAVPFAVFLLLTFGQGQFGEPPRYWFYFAKTCVGAWMVWEMRSLVPEMRWAISWEAVLIGIAVCVMWVGIDGWYPKIGSVATPWNPRAQFGESSTIAWFFIAVRILGSTFVVPPLEEVFYRSFLYRYIVRVRFLEMPLNWFNAMSFVATSVVFGFEHHQWLAGILCGFAYQWLVLRKNRLGDAMTAHAITNFLLGIWVVWQNDWKFW